MATDDIFGEDESEKSTSQDQNNKTIYTSTEKVSDKSWSKNVKLGFLALISFAIPVIFFLQANELKRKELKNASDLKSRDSLQMQLNNYYDTSLQNAKILAYKAYILQLSTLGSNGDNPSRNSLHDSDKILNRLQSLTSKINIVSNEVSDVRRRLQNQLPKGDPYRDTLSFTEFNHQMNLINSEIAKIKIAIENLSKSPSFNDSLNNRLSYFRGQINQFDKRLADLRIWYGNKNNAPQLTRSKRQTKTINQFMIDKTQQALDSLINDLNTINK